MPEFLISWEALWFAAFLCAVVGAVACDSLLGALALTLMCLLGADLFFDSGLWHWIVTHPGAVVFYGLLYLALGCAWSILKWHFHVQQNKDKIQAAWTRYSLEHVYASKPEFLASTYNPVTVSGNKQRLVTWITWWPASVLWTFLHDFLRAVWDRLYEVCKGIYDAVLSRALD